MDGATALYALKRLRIHAEDPSEAMGVLLDTRAVATWLGLSASTLNEWRCRGEGPPFIKLGGGRMSHVRYVVGDVIGWLQERSAGPNGVASTTAGA